MFSRSDLEPLFGLAADETSPILSLYLDVDLSQPANRNRGFEAAARTRLAALRDELAGTSRVALIDRDVEAALAFLRGCDGGGRSLVLFCDASRDLLWNRTLQVALPSETRYAVNPFLRPLLEMMDEHERYGIVLTDRQHARLFTVFLGEIEEHRQALAEQDVRVTRTVGTDHLFSEKRFQRRAEEHAHLHLKRVAGMLRDLQRRLGFDLLVLAGPHGTTTELQRLLPRALNERVAAAWNVPLDVAPADLLQQVMLLQDGIAADREERLIADLTTAAAGSRQAVLGLSLTLEALRQGRVVSLVYLADRRIEGGRCVTCGTLAQRSQGSCRYCQAPLRPVRDLLGRMAHAVAESGGRLDRLRGPLPKELPLEDAVGAFLRF